MQSFLSISGARRTLGWALLLLIMACGTTSIYLTVTRPAEINLSAYRKIVIGDIVDLDSKGGHHAADLADKITEGLFASQAYEVLDRQNMVAILQEHSLGESGLIDENTAPQIGQIIGSAAMVFGRIQVDSYTEEVTHQKPYTDKDGKTHEWQVRKGVYRLSATLKVIDVETARILAVKTVSARRTATRRADKKVPAKIDPEPLYVKCADDITRQFIRMIAPYQVQVRAAFLTDKLLPEVDQAVGLFRIGEWEDGIAILDRSIRKKGLGSDVQSKAFYNLGLALIYTGQYDEAIEQLKTALSLNPTSKRIQSTVLRAKEEKANAEKLEEQKSEG
ncbi:MAG: tetratricopeptide repeat protein [Candidatus Marinimicrobia bacterium]|nr:tetratricopeptide repeat protein [Candidatus Neomarinimicrobiota bacterium]